MATPFARWKRRRPSWRSLRVAVGAARSHGADRGLRHRSDRDAHAAAGCNAPLLDPGRRAHAHWLAMSGALFEPDGSGFFPPSWRADRGRPEALHGGPPAALLARCVERVPGGDGMMVARLTVELLRPVPVSPLAVETRVLRPGRKVQLVGRVAARRGRRGRPRDGAAHPHHRSSGAARDRPTPSRRPVRSGGCPAARRGPRCVDYPAFHNQGVEHRFVAGGFDRPGPATDWIRLRVPAARGRGDEPARSRRGGRRLRQRRQLGPVAQRRLAVHQPRPDDRAPPPCRRASGCVSRPRRRSSRTGSGRRSSRLWDERGAARPGGPEPAARSGRRERWAAGRRPAPGQYRPMPKKIAKKDLPSPDDRRRPPSRWSRPSRSAAPGSPPPARPPPRTAPW